MPQKPIDAMAIRVGLYQAFARANLGYLFPNNFCRIFAAYCQKRASHELRYLGEKHWQSEYSVQRRLRP